MKKNRLTEKERSMVRNYFKDCTTLQFHQGQYNFDDTAKHIRIGVLKAKDFDYLKKDCPIMFISTERGLIELKVSIKTLLELKKELFRLEAIYIKKQLKWIGKSISSNDVKWDFQNENKPKGKRKDN